MKPLPSLSLIEALESRIAPAGVSSIDLGSLNGTNGFKITGSSQTDLGASISNAGDVNGDGIDDLVVSAPAHSSASAAGAVYVLFGKKTGFTTSFDPATLNGADGFALLGEGSQDEAGSSAAGAGDINGDGFADIVIGAQRNDSAGVASGIVYVVYGHAGAFPASTSLGALGAGGTKISTSNSADLLGSRVAGAGDVNGDGYDDLVIAGSGIRDFGIQNNGAAFVVFGKAGGLGSLLTLNSLNGSNGFKMVLDNGNSNSVGFSVAGAGDVNGDGFADVLVTAPTTTEGGSNRGAAFVIFGKPSGFTASMSLSAVTGASGFKVNATADGTRLGDSANGIGDINGDGYDDFAVSALGGSLGDPGASYVVFGRPGGFGAGFNITQLDGTNGFKISGIAGMDAFGTVSGPGDFNADGIDDLLVGASGATEVGTDSGAAYVIYGKKTSFSSTFDLSSLDGTNGLKLRGAVANGGAGDALGFGDFNGDGFDDALVGAPLTANHAGTAFVAFGSGTPVKISANGKIATFTESDGDLVTIKVTKGFLTRADFTITVDGVFQKLDLRNDNIAFAGANVTITAKKPLGDPGDGKVNVGAIDARGSDLGKVIVTGNLGQIDAGDSNPLTRGLVSLVAGSLGGNASTQPTGTAFPFLSRIEGSTGPVTLLGDLAGVLDVRGKLGPVKVIGSLDSAPGGDSAGLIRANGDISSVTITKDLKAGLATLSGIMTNGKLGRTVILGNVVTNNTTKPATISALGKLNPKTAADAVAISSVFIKGGTQYLRVLAGYSSGLVPLNGDAGIGSVVFGSGVVGTSVVAGIVDTSIAGNLSSAANGFGRNDTAIGGGVASIISRIGSIVVKGNVIGNANFFGLTAEQIGRLSVTGKLLDLKGSEKVTINLLNISNATTNVVVAEL